MDSLPIVCSNTLKDLPVCYGISRTKNGYCVNMWYVLLKRLSLKSGQWQMTLKTYAAISNAHLSRVCKRGKLTTLNGLGSTQLPIFLCHIGVPTFSSQNN